MSDGCLRCMSPPMALSGHAAMVCRSAAFVREADMADRSADLFCRVAVAVQNRSSS
jgi:hypothetical protein